MKAALCTHCTDVVTPFRDWRTNRSWRWCECLHAGVRWQDGDRGVIEVTAVHGPEHVRVIGLNNSFLVEAVGNAPEYGGATANAWWRHLHRDSTRDVDDGYLFHVTRRECWALVVRVGESGDIVYVPGVVPPYSDATPQP